MLGYYGSEIELLGDVAVLAVAGETNLSTAPQFRRDLDQAMKVTAGDVILDLADLELVDSSALGIMIAAVTGSEVLRVFAITGLLAFFSIATTRTEAMARVGINCEGEEEVSHVALDPLLILVIVVFGLGSS